MLICGLSSSIMVDPGIIGICGRIGVGKSWVAEQIHTHLHRAGKGIYGQTLIMEFADELKRHVMTKYELAYDAVFGLMNHHVKRLIRIEGTAIEDAADMMVWVNKLAGQIDLFQHRGIPNFIIADVRFPHEANWIKQSGGFLIHVDAYKRNLHNKPHGFTESGFVEPACANEPIGFVTETWADELQEMADFTIHNDSDLKPDDVLKQIRCAIYTMQFTPHKHDVIRPIAVTTDIIGDSDEDDM